MRLLGQFRTAFEGTAQLRVASRGRAAFTLLELLMVIAIVAVLATLLIPYLGQLKEKAQSVACLGNLRQIAAAVALYSGENDGYVPPIQTDMRDENGQVVSTRWWKELSPYLKYKSIANWGSAWENDSPRSGDERVFLCPANPRKGNRGSAYVNYTGILNASGSTFFPTTRETRRKFASFQSPLSQLPYLIDGYASDNYSYIHSHAVDLYTGILSVQSRVNQQNPQEGIYAPLHGNAINILYLDGHAAATDIRDFATTSYNYTRP